MCLTPELSPFLLLSSFVRRVTLPLRSGNIPLRPTSPIKELRVVLSQVPSEDLTEIGSVYQTLLLFNYNNSYPRPGFTNLSLQQKPAETGEISLSRGFQVFLLFTICFGGQKTV